MSPPRRILVFLPNWVGDVVMATPVLRGLRESFPAAKIIHVGRPVALAVLDGNSWCDATITEDSKRPPRLWRWLGAVGRLRRARADLAVLLANSFRSAALAWLGGAKRRIGYDRDGRGWLLTDRISPKRDEAGRFAPVPMIDYYNNLLTPLGVLCLSRTMELPLTQSDQAAADDLLDQVGATPAGPRVMLNPGASFGTSKNWLPERYAAVADRLIESHAAGIIINAAPNAAEKALADTVAGAMQHAPLINFAQRDNTLGLLKGLLARCDLLISNDTGVRHIAAALGIGVVTIFGSTDPEWARIDHPRERICRVSVSCGPCQRKTCPLPAGDDYHKCMTRLSAESVFRAAEELLTEAPS